MSQFQVTKYCGIFKPFLVHPAKYICKTAVMKIPKKKCPQWNTERCLLRETFSMIFQFHLRVSHPSSLLRNSTVWDRWCSHLVHRKISYTAGMHVWNPSKKKESTNLNVFFSGILKKSGAAVFPDPKCPNSEDVPGMVERDVKRGDQGSGGGWCERLVYCWVKHGGFGGKKLRKLPLQYKEHGWLDGKIHHFLNIGVLDFERLFFLLSQC